MKHNMYAIHDKKAEAWLPPFFLHSEGMVIRAFTDCVNDQGHQFGKHPEDYTLMQIGSFDDEKGVVTPLQTQKPLGNGLAFVAKSEDTSQLSLVEEN